MADMKKVYDDLMIINLYNETIWTYFVKIEDRKCRNKQMSYFETTNYVRVTLISAYSIVVGRDQMDCLPLKTYKSQGW